MDDLLKEAIADAKAVRETALANAKMALEEAFTPKLKSMLAQKIQAEIEDDGIEDDGYEKEMSEEEDEVSDDEKDAIDSAVDSHEDDMHKEIEDDGVEDDDTHNEIEDDNVEDDKLETEEEESGIEDEDSHEKEVAYEGEDEESDDTETEDLDLEAILAELEADLNEEEDEDDEPKEAVEEAEEDEESDKVDEAEEIEENDVSSDIGKGDNKQPGKAGDSSDIGKAGKAKHTESVDEVEEEVEEDIDLDEVLKALSEEEGDEEDKVDELATLQAEIKEHRDVVKYLRGKLNEVNLLNAKLLFSNKLFRAFGLSNEQKLKVVETFDRTSNLREIKLVYSTLAESFKGTQVKPVNESKGSSSKPVASTKPANEEVLTEGTELKSRFKKLANIL